MKELKAYIHESRIDWLHSSSEEKAQNAVNIARMDSDAVVRMKRVGKILVTREDYSKEDLKLFYEMMDAWLREFISGETDLALFEKAALIRYAMDIRP